MASPTYRSRVLVLRKTKLGESDLILTLLAESGEQIRAVAKGARKPNSQFASRLELYSIADVLFASGKSLDIVKEARLIEGHDGIRQQAEHASCAACCTELLARISQPDLPNEKLFPLTEAAFAALSTADREHAPLIAGGHLLKTMAFAGLRPSLAHCVSCGRAIAPTMPTTSVTAGTHSTAQTSAAEPPTHDTLPFSYAEGGVLCADCALSFTRLAVSRAQLAWVETLIRSTFAEILALPADTASAFSALQFSQMWIREHLGSDLKSLHFLFTSGLYEAT